MFYRILTTAWVVFWLTLAGTDVGTPCGCVKENYGWGLFIGIAFIVGGSVILGMLAQKEWNES